MFLNSAGMFDIAKFKDFQIKSSAGPILEKTEKRRR
jgi:hypothetical protein